MFHYTIKNTDNRESLKLLLFQHKAKTINSQKHYLPLKMIQPPGVWGNLNSLALPCSSIGPPHPACPLGPLERPLCPPSKFTKIMKGDFGAAAESIQNPKAKAPGGLMHPECWEKHCLKHSAGRWGCACLLRDSHQELSLQCSLIIMGTKCCIACVVMGTDSFWYSMGLS